MAIFRVPPEFTYAQNAGADLSTHLNKLVKIDTDGDIVLCGDGEKPFGTLIESDLEDRPVTVQFGGIAKVVLGGTVEPGDHVASGAAGIGVEAAVGDHIIGVALTGGVSGNVIPVAIIPGMRHA